MTETEQRLVSENVKLVYHLAWKLRNDEFVSHNRDDLTSEGMIGLIKAARAFDHSKGIKFATFASRCILNEMLMFMRKSNKHETAVSLNAVISSDSEGGELLLMDILSEKESNIERAERSADAVADLCEMFKLLTERENKIAFYLQGGMTQAKMAAELGISQSYVSRLVKKMRDKYKRFKDRCGSG